MPASLTIGRRHYGGDIQNEDTGTAREILNTVKKPLGKLTRLWNGLGWRSRQIWQIRSISIRTNTFIIHSSSNTAKDKAGNAHMTEWRIGTELKRNVPVESHHKVSQHAHLTQSKLDALKQKHFHPVVRFPCLQNSTHSTISLKLRISLPNLAKRRWDSLSWTTNANLHNFAVAVWMTTSWKITNVLRMTILRTPKNTNILLKHFRLGNHQCFGHSDFNYNTETGKKLFLKFDELIHTSFEQYKRLGYFTAAMFNFIALLGWSPKGTRNLQPKTFVEIFDENVLVNHQPPFDPKKLEFNKQHT